MVISRVFNFAKNYYVAAYGQKTGSPQKIMQMLERWKTSRDGHFTLKESLIDKIELRQNSEDAELEQLFKKKPVWGDGAPLVLKYDGKPLHPLWTFGAQMPISHRKKTTC